MDVFHYTTIESLAAILDSNAIKFNRFSELNDPEEGKATDSKVSNKLGFCSSWTYESKESIPLWKMYSGFEGIRIQMPPHMFDVKTENQIVFRGIGTYTRSILKNQILLTKANDFSERGLTAGLSSLQLLFGPDEMIYDNEKNKYSEIELIRNFESNMLPELKKKHPNLNYTQGLNFSNIGIIKNEAWTYEKEVRYRLFSIGEVVTFPNHINIENLLKNIEFKERFVLVPLREGILEEMKIVMGPKCNRFHRIIVESLLERYTSSYSDKIKQSDILIQN